MISSVTSGVTPEGIPVTQVRWDASTIPLTPDEAAQELYEGSTGIKVGADEEGLTISPHTLQDGEERIVAQRVTQVLGSLG